MEDLIFLPFSLGNYNYILIDVFCILSLRSQTTLFNWVKTTLAHNNYLWRGHSYQQTENLLIKRQPGNLNYDEKPEKQNKAWLPAQGRSPGRGRYEMTMYNLTELNIFFFTWKLLGSYGSPWDAIRGGKGRFFRAWLRLILEKIKLAYLYHPMVIQCNKPRKFPN